MLLSAALGPHRRIEEMLSVISHTHPSNAEPRRTRELADTFMATTSRHLAAVDDALLPAARGSLTDGHDMITGYVGQAREFEQALHALKASVYGDANVRRLHGDELWTEVRRLLSDHEAREERLVNGLVASLPDEQISDLAERCRRTEEHSPTRPHPYTPHTGMLGRVVHRVWSVVDSFWDSAEGRVIPRRLRPPHPRRNSLTTRYVMGSPGFDESDRYPRE
jgi:hypothetical protein